MLTMHGCMLTMHGCMLTMHGCMLLLSIKCLLQPKPFTVLAAAFNIICHCPNYARLYASAIKSVFYRSYYIAYTHVSIEYFLLPQLWFVRLYGDIFHVLLKSDIKILILLYFKVILSRLITPDCWVITAVCWMITADFVDNSRLLADHDRLLNDNGKWLAGWLQQIAYKFLERIVEFNNSKSF